LCVGKEGRDTLPGSFTATLLQADLNGRESQGNAGSEMIEDTRKRTCWPETLVWSGASGFKLVAGDEVSGSSPLVGSLFLSRFAAETSTDSGDRSFPQFYLTTLQPEQGAMSNSELLVLARAWVLQLREITSFAAHMRGWHRRPETHARSTASCGGGGEGIRCDRDLSRAGKQDRMREYAASKASE